MDILIYILSFLLQIAGIVGCVAPVLPGPPLSLAGILLLYFTDKMELSLTLLIGWIIMIVILQILDYITPVLGSKFSGGTPSGKRGCMAGTILGLFFIPWGIILGPFIGALIGELMGGNQFRLALFSAIGSLIGFVLGSLLKIIFCCYLLIYTIATLI